MNKVYFNYVNKKTKLKYAPVVKHLISNIFLQENKQLKRVDYILCSDDYLLGINKEFLKHATLTDVITFVISDPHLPIIGEIYISTDRVEENAKIFKVEYYNELLRVMIHGALHLCGYKDKTFLCKKQMREKEDYYLHF